MEIKKQSNNCEKKVIRNEHGAIISGVNNPNGKAKGTKAFTTVVREALERYADGKGSKGDIALATAILDNAIKKRDPASQRLIWNYFDGMPPQEIDTKDNITIHID